MIDSAGTRDLMDELNTLLREGEEDALEIFLRLVRPEDVAEWLDQLSGEQRQRVLTALDAEAAGTVLTDTTASIRAELVEDLDPRRLARIAEALPADEAADLIGELEDEETERVLHHISDEDEEVLRRLLTYPEDTAGGIMNPHLVALSPTATVDDAIQVLRAADDDTTTAALYVVDPDNRLIGYVRLRHLVTARPGARIGDLMETDIITVPVDADQEEVADEVEKYDFVAIPVVDADGLLLGAVTVDDVLGVIEEEATEDIYKMAGSSLEEDESESIFHIARFRLPWLLVCLGGTYAATLVLETARSDVPAYEELSVFIAAIMAMAGNASIQSSTTTVRRLALDTLPRSRFVRHVGREVLVAFLMGFICGAVAVAGALVFPPQDPVLGLALGLAMALGMSAASLFGAAMPLTLDLAGIDPAVASGPLVTTINDALVLAIYFSVATGVLFAFR
jgi:magnesium transporter